jgi:protein arginine kinase activator
MADELFGLGAALEIEQAGDGTGLKCPACGFTQADFKKAGRLGCPECYETFAEPMGSLLKTMHKGTRHVGKVPESLRQSRDVSDRLKNLQKRITKAIEEEDFEKAAILRDEIKQITVESASNTTS